jgi:hypothetical protein
VNRFAAVALLIASAGVIPAAAQTVKPLRELTTDRPDLTESPITVDKGHFQLEVELVNYANARASGATARSWGFGIVNAKLGVRDDIDVQLITQARERITTGSTTASSTLPDFTARVKWNLWGDDGGRTAFALMPFVTIPRDGGESTIGLVVPWSTELGRGWDMGAMSEIDVTGDQVDLIHSATFGHDLTGRLGMYAELASDLPNHDFGKIALTADTGLMYRVGANLQFDSGVQIGLDDRAERVRAFVGVSRRY